MPRAILVGVSGDVSVPRYQYDTADYLELKRVSGEEASRYREAWPGPLYFHLQYAPDGSYLLPTSSDFSAFREELLRVRAVARPPLVSLHFGPAARKVRIVDGLFLRAEGPLLRHADLRENLECNLTLVRECFPGSRLLIENQEYIPDSLSRGAYRAITEPSSFTKAARAWHRRGLIDGIILDIAHGLITAGNHPAWAGGGGLAGRFERFTGVMPLELVEELHISGIGRMEDGTWVDTHGPAGAVELDALAAVLGALGNGREISVTIEHNTGLPALISAVREAAAAA
ncbi:MAG: hypothetical protein ACOC8N_00515 [Spirochaetota bacterium]